MLNACWQRGIVRLTTTVKPKTDMWDGKFGTRERQLIILLRQLILQFYMNMRGESGTIKRRYNAVFHCESKYCDLVDKLKRVKDRKLVQ